MTTTPSRFPVVYLVELFCHKTLVTEDTDVCAKLELAVQRADDHVRNVNQDVHVEVSFDDDGVIEGVGVFNDNGAMLACVSVYHLDRDTGEASNSAIADACRSDPLQLQAALNRIFRN
jgi:hypothetical protein